MEIYRPSKNYVIITSLFAPLVLLSGCMNKGFQAEPLPLDSKYKAEIKTYDQAGTPTTPLIVEIGSRLENFQLRRAEASKVAKPSVDTIEEFLKAGFNLSDASAELWFDKHYQKDINSRFLHDTVNTVLGTATAVVGIADGSSTSVALLGAGTVAVNNQWQNYEAAYLLSTSLPTVIDKIKEARKAQREEMLKSVTELTTYEDAVHLLMVYHDSASRKAIKLFIEQSVKLAEYSVGDSTKLGDLRQIVALGAKIHKAINGVDGAYSPQDIAALVTFFFEPAGSEVVEVLKQIPAYVLLQASLTASLADSTKKDDVISTLFSAKANREIEKIAAKMKSDGSKTKAAIDALVGRTFVGTTQAAETQKLIKGFSNEIPSYSIPAQQRDFTLKVVPMQ
jgi:hypothetical protein